MSGERRIEKERERLEKIFCNIEKSKLDACKSLIRQVAFMTVQLQELSETIPKNGLVIKTFTKNGEERIVANPEVILYNKLIPNHLRAVKQLIDFLPPSEAEFAKDELIEFSRVG